MKHFDKGLILFQHGRFADALAEYQQALAIDPQMADAHYQLGRCYGKLQYHEQAIRAYDTARALDSKLTVKALAGIAEVYASSGQPQLAEETSQKALKIDSNNVETLVFLGKLKWSEGRPAEARSWFEKVLAINPNHTESHLMLADIAMRDSQYEVAEGHLKKIIAEIDPKNIAAALALAKIYRFTKREDKAIDTLRQILKDNPNNVQAHGALAETYFSSNRLNDARKEIEAYLALSPRDAQAHLLLGAILMKQNDYEKAVIHLTTAASAPVASAQTLYLLGLALKQTGKPAQAISSFQKALTAEPGNTTYRLALAQTFLSEGSFEEAQREITSVLSAEPENEYARQLGGQAVAMRQAFEHIDSLLTSEGVPEGISDNFKLGLKAFRSGDLQQAQALCEDLANVAPKSPLPLNLLGLIYLKRNQPERALAYFTQASAVDPKFAASYVNMANVYLAIGSNEQAIQNLRKSMQLSPKDQFIQLRFVKALVSARRYDEAEAFLEKLIRENPDKTAYRMTLADLFLSTNQYEDARKELAQSLKLDPKNVATAYLLAETLARRGDAKGAAAGFEALLRIRQGSGSIRARLALCDLALGLPEKAQEVLAGHSKADNKSSLDKVVRALILEQQGRSGDAEKVLAKLRSDVPDESVYELMLAAVQGDANTSEGNAGAQGSHLPEVLRKSYVQLIDSKSLGTAEVYELSLGIALSEVKWHVLGLQQLEKVSAKVGPNASLLEIIGGLWEKEGKPDKAVSCYQTAVAADSSYWPAHYRLGLQLLRDGKATDAEEHLRSALKYQPDSVAILLSLARACELTGNEADTIEIYRKINELRPNYPSAMNNLAWLLAKSPATLDQALQYAQSAVRAQPYKAEVRDTLGWIFFQKGKYDQAREQLDKAVFFNAVNPSIRYHRGMVYLKLNDKAKALEDFKQAAASSVSFPEEQLNESMLHELS